MAHATEFPLVDVQIATNDENIPANTDFKNWLTAALPENKIKSEITVRIVGIHESQELNLRYRNQDKPTNILSFPNEATVAVDPPLLGDLVICAPVIEEEAREQGKATRAHWAHIVVHGALHLLGYDHEKEDDASEMEALETKIVKSLGFPPPYKPI